MTKTKEEIEALKENWLKDPCWDIETTEGFEAHHDELLAWRNDLEIKHKLAQEVREQMRFEHVMNATGVADKEIAMSLETWHEIESTLRYSRRESINFDYVAAAQVSATLLMAAQCKRIADALEKIEAGNSLSDSVRIEAGE